MFLLVLTEDAREDVREAYNYYEGISPGLGEDFLLILEQYYRTLQENPFLYGYTDTSKTTRDVAILRFPYVIIFEVHNSTVIIYTVHNTYKQIKP